MQQPWGAAVSNRNEANTYQLNLCCWSSLKIWQHSHNFSTRADYSSPTFYPSATAHGKRGSRQLCFFGGRVL